MKALIIAAHGSRRKESNMEVAALAGRLAKKAAGTFDLVDHAFLQFAEPLLETRLEEVASKGARDIVVFPLFIASGSHILVDIPDVVQRVKAVHPHVVFRITDHLGKLPAVEEIILDQFTAS